MSARLAARFGCDRPVACLAAGGAGGGGGFPAVARLPVGLVEGAGGGAFRPVPVGGAPPFATGGFGADGPFGINAGLLTLGLVAVTGKTRPTETGVGRSAGAGGGAGGDGLGGGISS